MFQFHRLVAINNTESMEQSKITNNNWRLTPLTYRFRGREQKHVYRVNEAIVCVRGFSALWSLVSKCRWSKNRLKISSGIKPVITSVKRKLLPQSLWLHSYHFISRIAKNWTKFSDSYVHDWIKAFCLQKINYHFIHTVPSPYWFHIVTVFRRRRWWMKDK